MLDKEYLSEIITSKFPDLYNTKFEINSQTISSFTLGNLLPFLVYQNTIDLNHRLIGLYLPEDKSIINIVPFYMIIGQYRKLLNKAMEVNNYQNNSYSVDQIQVTFGGSIAYISSVDFINRQLNLKFAQGKEMKLPFVKSYKIAFLNKHGQTLNNKIEAFEKIDQADQTNIFTLPFDLKENQYEGVIIFTNTSKFESLIQNIKVSGNDLRNHLNIEKVVFPSNSSEHKFIRLSNLKTANKPVSVLVARQDAFNAYSQILASGGKRLTHIKTIVIDDFDELVIRWDKAGRVGEEINELNENYFKQLNENNLKDLYLICRNSSLNIHEILKKFEINYHPWLVKPIEAQYLNEEISIAPEITITNVGDSKFENLNESINILINSWKNLSDSNYCNGEIVTPIKHLYELRAKLNSFFSPNDFKILLNDFLINLALLRSKYFFAGQDYNLISNTENLIKNKFIEIKNYKFDIIVDFLKNKAISGLVMIISDNDNNNDILWVQNSIRGLFPFIRIEHHHKKKSFQLKSFNSNNSEVIFYLSADKITIGKSLGNILAVQQMFILNNKAYSFALNYSKKYQQLQNEVGNSQFQYSLLNSLEPKNSSAANDFGIIPIKYKKNEIDDEKVQESIQFVETELNDLVEGIILKHKNENPFTSDKYMLLFDDSTFEIFPENRRMYLYEDDKETDDIEKSLKTVCELRAGEQIIIPKKNAQIKDLLNQVLEKNRNFSESIETDLKWRILINNHIKRCGIDLNFFRRKLKSNGFVIGSDQTIQHWIDSDTRRPDNFKGLLNALARLEIINMSEINSYDVHNLELKSIQIRFVRTAIVKLLSRLNGIDVEYDENFNDELLNDFIDHIEIKKISSLYKL